MKIFKIVAILLVVLSLFLELLIFSGDSKEQSNKPLVSVSTFSLYDITKHIAGESVQIINILPFGVDPHSFELTPKIMANIEKSSLVFYSGAGLEPWIEKISFSVEPINMSKYVHLRKLAEGEHHSHGHDDEDEHQDEDEHEHEHHDEDCSHSELDPHYWLDFENMQKMVYVVSDELIKILPQNKSMYEKNRDTYIKMLIDLDTKYKSQLHSCEMRSVILNHNFLGYVADKYDFHVNSLNGLSPEAEPSASDIKRILQEIKESGVHTLFYESFINAKVIESISRDTHVKIEVLQPLGNITADEAKANATYNSLMLQNLEKLKKAMICH
ncbi:zinc ABC transporter substrate-binding protein [Sulfurimonas sp. SAG-AH-194-L11]|nr:metal ABC transporter substrate-binding protein [Sulfurimonas sp. SAG-AH-194-L11]MDF1876388.1 zinc ABC transporter substrate-binding protein [Sulfurimonas sp. SAG-AH-194-L11]